jgi:hypothetical protein
MTDELDIAVRKRIARENGMAAGQRSRLYNDASMRKTMKRFDARHPDWAWQFLGDWRQGWLDAKFHRR